MTYSKLKKIGIIAHVDAGKTTLTERILYFTGESHCLGDVHHGDTVTDSSVQEREKGITINSAAVTVEWKNHRINIIDTPGHIDFNIEVNRSLRVLDGAVVVFDAVAGVEPQSETNWRLADKYSVPRVCLVNKMDRIGADYFSVIQSIESQLAVHVLVLQLPIGAESDYRGLIDVVSMRAMVWVDDQECFSVECIPENLVESAKQLREKLLYALAEVDNDLMEDLLEGRFIPEETLHQAIRKATLMGKAVPICCASAFKNKGVEPLLDAVIKYLPSPEDKLRMAATCYHDESEMEVACTVAEPFCALAFKMTNDKHGSLTYLRVYSGQLSAGEKVLNCTNGKSERIGRIYLMHADKREAIDSIMAGDIVAVLGLKDTDTGDTLCDVSRPVVLERISVPSSVIDIAIEAKTKQEQCKLADAIRILASEDPSLCVGTGSSGETLLSGMGELHLEIVISRLRTDFDVEVTVGKPQVAYRETMTEAVEVSYTHKKQRGGPGQFAEVTISFIPIESEEIEFESKIAGACIPREFIPSVEAGIRKAAQNGVLGGYPCAGFKAVLTDGAIHAQDSSQLAFEIAGNEAFCKAARIAKPALLEPMMALEIVTPQECVGDCIGDLNRRRGKVNEQSFRGNGVVIYASVPLSNMFGYIGDLRSLTAGRASFSMTFERYEVVPRALAESFLQC